MPLPPSKTQNHCEKPKSFFAFQIGHIEIGKATKSFFYFLMTARIIFTAKKIISIPLMTENPVRSPIVPPIADNISTNFAASSFVILSNVGVSK